ncbi:outer membrane beta-barrel family protein [Flavitalea sp. BT771]|uniref:outer membrane beta-barrel family protein n=1 Tax=Flavitalea sp. BT771 TaxID=3063329 RepID=UPI0026E171F5|nr:outer membrane beta-barrel family protein [Flavitalea sp. BT771]MDO6432858.1 outer membrane beta-barrel family protein [Flavitalea sp. BT771]MDV6221866.1 outer membrane beta-barrel family protein [Flavitalea sp. BT771]
MRKLLLTLTLFLFFASFAMAQTPSGQAPGAKPAGPGGPGAGAQAPPSIGRAYGKITDSTGQPMGQVSALVLKTTVDPTTKKKKQVLIKGTETKANGEFDLEDLPIASQLTLKLSATGYKPQDINFMIIPAAAAAKPGDQGNPMAALPSFSKDLGIVKLTTDTKELSTVTVSAKTPAMRLDMDKKVFNVDRNIVSTGGTAQDVMRNVPSVNVDIDGNVSLRGASPTIFVDGRPTTLSLDQIPADAIESVEVMTNPSAKYDASGGGSGIINIILKKNRKQGYNGSISAGVDSRGGVNSLVGLNARQGKVNLSLNGMYNGMRGKTVGNTDRYTYLSDTTTHLLQNDLQRNIGHFMFGQVGLDYFVTNKTTVSASFIKVHGTFKPTDVSDIQTDSLNLGKPTTYSQRRSNSERTFDVNGVQVGMKHLFAKEGEQLTADGSTFWVTSHSSSLYTTDYYTGAPGSAVNYTTRQLVLGTADPAFTTFQTDYTNPIGKVKLEAGLRATFQKLTNYNDTYVIGKDGDSTLTPYGTSNYTSISRVYAAYINLSSTIGKFGYSLGLRGESSNYSGDLLNTKQHFHNSYPITLFPSLFLSQKLAHNQELQLSATRKVNRPGFFQLIPYTDYSDTLNITRGNPDLVPEFTNSFEMSYMKTFPHSNTLLISGYYKYTSNLMTRYQDSGVNPIGKPVLINTYENANNAYTVGGEITSTDNITKWWDITANFNIYNSHINTDNLKQASQDALWSWFGKFNSNFKLPANFSIQATFIYQSKTNIPANQQQNQFGPPGATTQTAAQGYIKAFYGFDMAVKKTFLKNNAASITASMSDIFRNRWSNQYSHSPYFAQQYDRLKDPQLFRVVFAYRFGKMDLNLFKRKDMNSQGPPSLGN